MPISPKDALFIQHQANQDQNWANALDWAMSVGDDELVRFAPMVDPMPGGQPFVGMTVYHLEWMRQLAVLGLREVLLRKYWRKVEQDEESSDS